MSLVLRVLSTTLILAGTAPAWANGGGGMSMPSPSMSMQQTPQQKARDAYNDGVHYVKRADKAQEAAASATDTAKKDKATHEAQEAYASARSKFTEATGLDPAMHEAWNYVGYTNRKLGNYDDALVAYDKALSLKPGYADALEYRGEAYLGLSRIPDAQQAYLDLYAGNRALAGKLLTAMKNWSTAQRTATAANGNINLDELDKWIQERAQIAGQTAALTRAGTAASWR